MEEIKYTRFEYLSWYYNDLLLARLELEKKWSLEISFNWKKFSLWKVKWVDDIAREVLPEMLDKMIIKTENELRHFLNKQDL